MPSAPATGWKAGAGGGGAPESGRESELRHGKTTIAISTSSTARPGPISNARFRIVTSQNWILGRAGRLIGSRSHRWCRGAGRAEQPGLGDVIDVLAGDSLHDSQEVGHRPVAPSPLGGPGAQRGEEVLVPHCPP